MAASLRGQTIDGMDAGAERDEGEGLPRVGDGRKRGGRSVVEKGERVFDV